MNPSYIGAVWMFGGNFAPINFNFCDGSLQSIAENEALYTLLGTMYGGDGQNTFGLPDLRGRVCIGQGSGPGLSTYVEGQISGNETITITTSQMAGHTHLVNAGTAATTEVPASNLYLNQLLVNGAGENIYSTAAVNAAFTGATIGTAGGSIPIEIIQPTLAISYIIALYGIYPTQN